jgi:hypothetical protein
VIEVRKLETAREMRIRTLKEGALEVGKILRGTFDTA